MNSIGIPIGVLSVVMVYGCASTEKKIQSSGTKSKGSPGVKAKAKSEASLRFQEWRLVYQGSEEKCYTVKYVRNEGTGELGIRVEVNDQNRDRLDYVGESTDVCGTRIILRGESLGGPSSIAYWSATIIRGQTTETCVQQCQRYYREQVKQCDIFYPPASQPRQHRECLNKAKTKFDACMSAC